MKSVQITEISEPNKKSFRTENQFYQIRLGNGKQVRFRNRRDADAFIVSTNSFLTDQLLQLNNLYTDVFKEYRQAWFYLDGRTAKTKQAMQQVETKIKKHLESVQWVFDNIYRSGYLRNNDYPFKLLGRAAEHIVKICELLIEIRRKRKEFVERKTIEILRNNTIILVRQLANFGCDMNFTYNPINEMVLVLEKLTLKSSAHPFY